MPTYKPAQHESTNQSGDSPGHVRLTPALPTNQWVDLFAWAHLNDVSAALFLLLDATVAIVRPGVVGSVLHFVGRPHILETLESWSLENTYAAQLHPLVRRLVSAPEILSTYPPLDDARPASQRFHGNLESAYVLALLATRNPYPRNDTIARIAYDRLRLWLLLHAAERVDAGSLCDLAIRDVATRLRLAGDDDPYWRTVVNDLPAQTLTLAALEFRLQRTTERRLRLSPQQTERSFLRNLGRIARHESHPDPRNAPPRIVAPAQPTLRSPASLSPLRLNWETDDEVEGVPVPQLLTGFGPDGTTMLETEVPIDATLARQRLHASSVILASVEENQFLPWSWDKPMPHELRTISAWIEETLEWKGPLAERIVAAVAWIALRTGRSLRRVLEMRIGTTADEEWSFDPVGHLHRLPPRRENSWKPDAEARAWIVPLADRHIIPMPANVANTIRDCIGKSHESPTLGDLAKPSTVLRSFGDAMRDRCPRITSGMLARVLPLDLHQRTTDGIFARMFCRHPQSGLPGAAAYPSWLSEYLPTVIGSSDLHVNDGDTLITNAMGSRLDTVESLLVSEIRRAGMRLLRRRRRDNIEFHNALTAYLVVALHAATGVRPVRTAFESIRNFDLTERFAFVEDKASGASRQGRLVPLPTILCQYLSDRYLTYLCDLADAIAEAGDPVLGSAIRSAATGTENLVPLFFGLRRVGGTLVWEEVGEAFIEQQNLFRWPLPLRHFRHRLATRLRRRGVNTEIIDGILGHAERGSASYSDRSARIWQEDIERAREHLESDFAALGFLPVPLSIASDTPPLTGLTSSGPHLHGPHAFGKSARTLMRRERLRAAVASATEIIDHTCAGRDLAGLDPDALTDLGQKLLFNSNGLPHASGTLRYSVMLRRLERAQRRHSHTIRLKRIYVALENEGSCFKSLACGASRVSSVLGGELARIALPRDPKRAVKRSLALGTIHLILESRLCDREALSSILHGRNFRIVGFREQHYLEYGPTVRDGGAGAICRRYSISHRTAQLLAEASRNEQLTNASDRPLEPALEPMKATIRDHLPRADTIRTNGEFAAALAIIVDQLNVMTMPGIAAGYLAGRVESCSVTWYDFTRLQDGLSRDFGDSPGKLDLATYLAAGVDVTKTPDRANSSSLQDAGRKLIARVRELLNAERDDTRHGREKRANLSGRLIEHVKAAGNDASQAPLALAAWTADLLTRHRRGGGFLAISAVLRYLDALARAFLETLPDTPLTELDDEEITEAYTNVIESVPLRSRHYSRNRLREFHQWLSLQTPISEPEWSEIPGAEADPATNPALISERDYLLAHGRLASESDNAPARLLLLLAYRLGLRGGEALGLLRSELYIQGANFVVMVQNNRLRKIKTKQTSRRLVPLNDTLTDDEQALIDRTLAQLEATHGSDLDVPLFGKLATGGSGGAKLRRRVITHLKAATGNPRTNLHHARHTAANRLAARTFGVSIPGLHANEFPDVSTRRLLLGTERPTRRALPAVERWLGHGQSGTTVLYYLHLLDFWCEQLTGRESPTSDARIEGVTYLDDFPPRAADAKRAPSGTVAQTPAQFLMLLRLLTRGHDLVTAAERLGLDIDLVEQVVRAVDTMASKFRYSRSARAHMPSSLEATPALANLLTRIPDSRWSDLITHTAIRAAANPTLPTMGDIQALIGPSRQLLMWTSAHFTLVRSWLDWLGLSEAEITVAHTPRCRESLIAAARQSGFCSIEADKMIPKIQIDPARTGPNDEFRVEARLAIQLRETEHPIRHAAELCLVLLVASLTGRTMAT